MQREGPPWQTELPDLERELSRLWGKFSPSGHVAEAAAYSLFAGGKRLRPLLVTLSHRACGGAKPVAALRVGLAIEMIHTYSLIHDDLPALDDDEFRRGRPTCHKVYGPMVALMAGDLLQVAAFWTICKTLQDQESLMTRVAREVSIAAGATGMVAGQVADLEGEGAPPAGEVVDFIHTHKTAALIRCCCRVGGLMAGAPDGFLEALASYGEKVGLAFQVVDDILDLEGDPRCMGKERGGDLRRGKITFPAVHGLAASRGRARRLVREACQALAPLGDRGKELGSLATYVISRKA